jgi:hypothetical protein
MWHARDSGARIVDATKVVVAVHQNHDYSYHPDGEKGVWEGEEALRNAALLDNGRLFRTLRNSTHILTHEGLRRNYLHYWVLARANASRMRSRIWFAALNWTRPFRHRLGLRNKNSAPAVSGSQNNRSRN